MRFISIFGFFALLAVVLVSYTSAQTCSEVGNAGAGIKGCWNTATQQVILNANGVTGEFCSFDDSNNTCCVLSFAAPAGSCTSPAQVVGILPANQYTCAIPQPPTVTACPRCNVICLSALSCGGGTDSCTFCKFYGNPWGTGVYRCAATAKRDDTCLNDEGIEISC